MGVQNTGNLLSSRQNSTVLCMQPWQQSDGCDWMAHTNTTVSACRMEVPGHLEGGLREVAPLHIVALLDQPLVGQQGVGVDAVLGEGHLAHQTPRRLSSCLNQSKGSGLLI